MTFEESIRAEIILNELNARFPFTETGYRNRIVATKIAKGKGKILTEDWFRRTFLADVEDGFITYSQVMAIKDEYMKAVNELIQIWG